MPNITIHTTYGEVYIVLLIFLVLIAAGHMRANAKNGRIEFYSAPIPSDKQQRHVDNHYRIFCEILDGTLPYEVTNE